MIPRAFLEEMFSEVVSACLPDRVMGSTLPDRLKVKGKTFVLGAGKASASMAAALEAEWDGPLEGLVITRYGHSWPTRSIEVVEAGHPIPDKAGMMATNRIMSLARSAKKDDLVIVPSITFVATYNAVIMDGAQPIISDVDSHTGLIELKHIVEW